MASFQSAEMARRFVSAAILIVVAAGAVVLGGTSFALLVAVAAGILAWEWSRMLTHRAFHPLAILSILGCSGTALTVGVTGQYTIALLVLMVLTATIMFVARSRKMPAGLLLGAGVPYFVIPALALLALRDAEDGFVVIAWLFATVWAADTGAFLVGRAAGGPKLWPRISPAKTWSGLFGGTAAGLLAGVLVALVAGAEPGQAALAGLLVSLAAAAGDLVESAFKRRFNVKDTSSLIPGHGGLLDRVDGVLIATPVVFVMHASGWRWL